MIGSQYLESKLQRVWPIFSHCECFICNRKLRRQWMWKFYKRRKLYTEPKDLRHACIDCTSANYNRAVEKLDVYFRNRLFQSRGTRYSML